jgi:hydroxymethylbilane synthase
MTLTVASRGSTLALWQAQHVVARLQAVHPGIRTDILTVVSAGDRAGDIVPSAAGIIGFFTAEVDRAVLEGRARVAVHSLKDLPVEPSGLRVAAILEREDPSDALVCAPGRGALRDLPAGARVGTSSLRRRALLLEARPDLRVLDLRGNVDTRLRRVADGDIDATVLALAGLRRLGRADRATEILPADTWLPAPGQGALAVTIAPDDEEAAALLLPLDDAPTRAVVDAERALLQALGGGCHLPVGALGILDGEWLTLRALVAAPDGSQVLRDAVTMAHSRPAAAGRALAARLRAQGAERVLGSAPGIEQ